MYRKEYDDLSNPSCEDPKPWAFHGELVRKKRAFTSVRVFRINIIQPVNGKFDVLYTQFYRQHLHRVTWLNEFLIDR